MPESVAERVARLKGAGSAETVAQRVARLKATPPVSTLSEPAGPPAPDYFARQPAAPPKPQGFHDNVMAELDSLNRKRVNGGVDPLDVAAAEKERAALAADPNEAERVRLLTGGRPITSPEDAAAFMGSNERWQAEQKVAPPALSTAESVMMKVGGPAAKLMSRVIPGKQGFEKGEGDQTYAGLQQEASRRFGAGEDGRGENIGGRLLSGVGELVPALTVARGPLSLGAYSGIQAPEGEGLKAAATGTALGWMGGKVNAAIAKSAVLSRLPEWGHRMVAETANNILIGAAARGGDFSEADVDTVLGIVQAVLTKNPGITQGRLQAEADIMVGAYPRLRRGVDNRRADRAYTAAEQRAGMADPARPEAEAYREAMGAGAEQASDAAWLDEQAAGQRRVDDARARVPEMYNYGRAPIQAGRVVSDPLMGTREVPPGGEAPNPAPAGNESVSVRTDYGRAPAAPQPDVLGVVPGVGSLPVDPRSPGARGVRPVSPVADYGQAYTLPEPAPSAEPVASPVIQPDPLSPAAPPKQKVGMATDVPTSRPTARPKGKGMARPKAPKPMTQAQAGAAKARYIAEGGNLAHVISEGRLKAAIETGKMPAPRTLPDGTIEAGYDKDAGKKGLIEDGAKSAVAAAEAMDIKVFSSGKDAATGEGYAVGEAPGGQVVEVKAPPKPVAPAASADADLPAYLRNVTPTAPKVKDPFGKGGGNRQPRMDNPERGAVVMPDLAKALKAAARGIGRAGNGVAGAVSNLDPFKRMITVVRQRGPLGQRVAEYAERALDAQLPYRKYVGDSEDAALGATSADQAHDLSRPNILPGKNYGPSMALEALEGRLPTTGPVKAAVDATRQHLDKSLEYKHDIGWTRDVSSTALNPQTNRQHRVVNAQPIPRQSGAAPRMIAPDGIAMLRSGNYKAWEDAAVDMNQGVQPEAEVRAIFKGMHDALTGIGPDAVVAQSAAESARGLKRMPGWIIGKSGEPVELLVSNLHQYNTSFARNSRARVGVTQGGFGQGATDKVGQLREAWSKAGNNPAEFDNLMRALHEVPVETPFRTAGEPGLGVRRGVGSFFNLLRSAKLSANFATSGLGEVITGPAATSGRLLDHAKGMLRTLLNPAAVRRGLHGRGIDTTTHVNRTVRTGRELSDSANKAANMIREVGSTWMENIQRDLAGAGAEEFVKRTSDPAYKASEGDVRDMMGLGFSENQARRFLNHTLGETRAARVVSRFIRRKIQEAQGSNTSGAQLSRFEHLRAGRVALAFQKYGWMVGRNVVKRGAVSVKMLGQGIAQGDWYKASAGVGGVVKVLAGASAATTINSLASALFLGGDEAFEVEWNKLTSNPIGYSVDSLLYGIGAGVMGGLVRQINDDGSLENMIFPYVAVREGLQVLGVVDGAQYEGRNFFQRVGVWTNRNVPMVRSFTTGLLSELWSDDNRQQMTAAKRGYYDYLKQNGLNVKMSGGERDEFDVAMTRLNRAIGVGRDPKEWGDLLREAAMGARDAGKEYPWESVAASLRGKRLLTDLKAPQRAALRRHVGDDAMDALVAHDALLGRVADSVSGE